MTPKKETIEVVPFDATINISVTGNIYARLTQLIFSNFLFENEEELKNMIELFKSGRTNENIKAYHLETLLALHQHIEECAREQKLIKIEEIEISFKEEEN
jgi:hypothetical protein